MADDDPARRLPRAAQSMRAKEVRNKAPNNAATPKAANIAARMEDCFSRQIAWLERLLAELNCGDLDLDDPALRELEANSRDHAKATQSLACEFEVLAAEWRAAECISDAARDRMGALARRAEALANELKDAYDKADAAIQTRLAALKESWDTLQRGRDMLRKYSPGGDQQASFVDKKA